MTPEELLSKWELEKDEYQQWGRYIQDQVEKQIKFLYPFKDDSYPVKIPVIPRLKSDHSLLDKAFHRGKYQHEDNPYTLIEDKVGLRFVMLLDSQVSEIANMIEKEPTWTARCDRSFDDRLEKPEHFDYPSTHFIIKPNDNSPEDFKVSPSCELQIRTLLQHAWCELSHQIAYKNNLSVKAEVKRALAKSAALIEATGDYLDTAASDTFAENDECVAIFKELHQQYEAITGRNEPPLMSSEIILDAILPIIPDTYMNDIRVIIRDKPYLVDHINNNYVLNSLYRQPTCLLLYLLTDQSPNGLKTHWPLAETELSPFYTDLGIAFEEI